MLPTFSLIHEKSIPSGINNQGNKARLPRLRAHFS